MKKIVNILLSCCAITLLTGWPSVSVAGYIRFMEGNGCKQNAKGETTDDEDRKVNFQRTRGFTNDDARSLLLLDVVAGTVIKVFDSPAGDTGDDWTEIVVNDDVLSHCIFTFQLSYEDQHVRVTYHPNNGLDGKVSRVEVEQARAGFGPAPGTPAPPRTGFGPAP